jgi:hypothetical protein
LRTRFSAAPPGRPFCSVRRLIYSFVGCATSNGSRRYQPGELGKCPMRATAIFPANSHDRSIGTKSGAPYTSYRSMPRKPGRISRVRDISHAGDGIQNIQ